MPTITGKSLATELCKKFPEATTMSLARRLYAEHPLKFANLSSARKSVCSCRGTNGKKQGTITAPRAKCKLPWVPSCPPSKAELWTPVVLDSPSRVLSLSDIHVPFHDKRALTSAVSYAKKRHNPNVLLLNGDMMDFYTISRYDKSPSITTLKKEVEAGKKCLEWLRHEFPKARFIYKLGNHEDRWNLFFWRRAPELFEIKQCEIDTVLEFEKHGIERVDDQMVMAGELPILHGHELGKSGLGNPVNPARGAFLRAHHSVLVGHLHQTSSHADTNLFHKETMCWSQGCLCELSPKYARVNRWNHGFAYVDVSRSGNYNLQNYRIGCDYKVRSA